MADVIKALLEERANVVEQARALNETAEKEGRDLTADAQKTWDGHMARVKEIDVRLAEEKDLLERNAKADEIRALYEKSATAPEAREAEKKEPSVDEQFKAWGRWERGMPGPGFELRGVVEAGREFRDNTLSSGASLIPQGFREMLWEYAVESSGILRAGVDYLETDSGNTIVLPRVTAYSTVGAATEATAISESDPTFSSVNSTVSKRGYTTQVSTELLQDSAFNLPGLLARWAGRELGNDIGSAAVTAALAAAGAGATTAAGTAGGLGSQGTTDRGFDYLITLYHSVLEPYRARQSCSWVMADPTAAMVRKVKSTEGVYAWQPSVVVGQPDTILGKPVYIDTNVPDAAVSVESIIFGDFSSLVVRVAGGIRFERSDDFAFNADLVTFRAIARHGTVSVDAGALKTLTHAGT